MDVTNNRNGKKKALFIGINYAGTKSELRGCHNDVKNISTFLFQRYGFSSENSMFLMDNHNEPPRLPTKSNIIAAMKWLVKDVQDGDTLVFHYSGHGASVNDTDGDEIDGKDEVLVPLDFDRSGFLPDDEVNAILVKPLPSGAHLFAILDCCHSATILDNPFTYTVDGSLEIHCKRGPSRISKALHHLHEIGSNFKQGNTLGAVMSIRDSLKTFTGRDAEEKKANHPAQQKSEAEKSSTADVIAISGCRDDQTSADAHISGNYTGAMSYALIKTLTEQPTLTYTELLKHMRITLQGKYAQVPQLSAGRQLDMNQAFVL